jgi:hypothetical protein
VIKVNPRAHRSEDRSGDPLDGLVNMFDIGIVLSLGFLLAALSALKLSSAITEDGLKRDGSNQIRVEKDATVRPVPADQTKVIGNGSEVGKVYRLQDGRLVYVVPPSDAASPSPSPSISPTPSSSP